MLVAEAPPLLDAFVEPPAAEVEVPLEPPLLALELELELGLELWVAPPPEPCVPEDRSEALEQAKVEQRSRPSRKERGCFEIAISKECPGPSKPGHEGGLPAVRRFLGRRRAYNSRLRVYSLASARMKAS
jgi:hypothetical protein